MAMLLMAMLLLMMIMMVVVVLASRKKTTPQIPHAPFPASGQLELLKLSFFPAVFAAAPNVGVLDSVLDGNQPECGNEGGWALEYAGAVRNILCTSRPSGIIT
jgi:hypothetical protein